MKRSAGILFILLATLVFLAHAFIPHHHHDRVIVGVGETAFHGNKHKAGHTHAHGHLHLHKHSHDHHPEDHQSDDTGSEKCLLDDAYLRQKLSRKQQLTSSDDHSPAGKSAYTGTIAAIFQQNVTRDYGEPVLKPDTDIPIHYTNYFQHSLSFRGPPVS